MHVHVRVHVHVRLVPAESNLSRTERVYFVSCVAEIDLRYLRYTLSIAL
jgi:hypothetical protein